MAMAVWTFEQLRAEAARLPDSDKDRVQIEITLAEHVVEAINQLREALVLSQMATVGVAGFALTNKGQELADRFTPDKTIARFEKLAKDLGLL